MECQDIESVQFASVKWSAFKSGTAHKVHILYSCSISLNKCAQCGHIDLFISPATSRSGSPSSRLAYLYHRGSDHDSPRPRRLSSGIPRSTQGSRDTSRETSPSRSSNITRFRRGGDRPPISPASRPVLAQKILQQSREAENALADVFVSDFLI